MLSFMPNVVWWNTCTSRKKCWWNWPHDTSFVVRKEMAFVCKNNWNAANKMGVFIQIWEGLQLIFYEIGRRKKSETYSFDSLIFIEGEDNQIKNVERMPSPLKQHQKSLWEDSRVALFMWMCWLRLQFWLKFNFYGLIFYDCN